MHAAGLPPEVNTFDVQLATKAYELARRWHVADVMGIGRQPEEANSTDIAGWGAEQACLCLCPGLKARAPKLFICCLGVGQGGRPLSALAI